MVNDTGAAAPLKIAVVDTDSGFLQVLGKRLEDLEWEFRVSRGPIPPHALVKLRVHALLVDLAVLGPQAWDYLAEVCEALPGLGVVVVTGRSSVSQRVRGLRMGVDDWITKPCHPEEVIARLEAVARRRRRAAAAVVPAGRGRLATGELEIRSDQFQVFVDERSAQLTRREFELIELLARADGQVLQREDIYERVWGYAMAHGDRSVDVFVRKLRQKLERVSPAWRYIHTHFGVGYRFEAEPVGAEAEREAGAERAAEPERAAGPARAAEPARAASI